MRSRSIIVSICICFLFGCEEIIDRPLASEETNYIIVTGIITNEKITHMIKLTRPYQKQNEIAQPVSGATITLAEDNTVYDLTETPAGSGEYYTPELRAVVGKTYTLTIQYDGNEFTAHDSPLPVEPLSPISYYAQDGKYLLNFNKSGQDPNFIDYEINWDGTPDCTTASCKGKLVFYDLKNVDVNDVYKPDKKDFEFPLNSTIIRRKYSVSAAYKNFLRAMLSETEWRGGVFDVQRADVPTNFNKGALGFFAVSTVVADTTIVQ
jgi:hypothetical protein